MKSISNWQVLTFVLCSVFLSTVGKGANSEQGLKKDTTSLLADRNFTNGISLKGVNSAVSPTGKYIYPFGKSQVKTAWELAEWGSRFQLSQDVMKTLGNTRVYSDQGKSISFEKMDDQNIEIVMGLTTSNEYQSPRKNGEAWPHLLLEQAFLNRYKLKDLKNLILEFEGRLVKSEIKMAKTEFNPGLHTAQFQLFITIQDQNPNSEKYGDFFWFGIPFYDYRHRESEVYAAKDIGKDDASGKFIYSLANRDFMKGSFHDGKWIQINHDLLPEILKAIAIARERGYLKGSADSDLGISGMNIGWEVPGTFDVVFKMKGFDLKVVK